MKRSVFLIFVLTFGFFSVPGIRATDQEEELYTKRFSLVIGANNGGKDRATLQFAADDARAVKEVLEDMGGVLPEDSCFLDQPSRANFLREIKLLSKKVNKAKEKFRRVEVIFYYSGHSDEENIFLGNSRVSYKEFREHITTMKADVRVAILDSCASGAFALTKGVIKKSPFLVDTAYDMKGYAFMTSSSANESAQESSRLKRSYFTHNLISGMRGAADMNQDGRITLSEAYQFAFDGTLTQTERTMAGPQHPNYHIQMSGTGDVVITEIRKSNAILVLKEDISGKIYIHNQDNFLVVELNKTAGREISIGLDAGVYRIINIATNAILETKVDLKKEQSFDLGRESMNQTDKIPTQLRGTIKPPKSVLREIKRKKRWRFELFGGFSNINPEDLNLRAKFDDLNGRFYGHDYLIYLQEQDEIISFTEANEGGKARYLKHSIPMGLRIRYGLFSWLDLSIGFSYLTGSRTSNYKNILEILDNDNSRITYSDELTDYTLAASGYIPSFGIHIGKDIFSSLRFEGFFTAGALFAKCKYSMQYITQWQTSGTLGDFENPDEGFLEEKGSGVGPAIWTGAKLDYLIGKNTGIFIEAGYAYQKVTDIHGPGIRSELSHRDTWEGEWAIKQDIRERPWGTALFLWPSNGWYGYPGTWWRARDFELNLSGFQIRVGLIYRF